MRESSETGAQQQQANQVQSQPQSQPNYQQVHQQSLEDNFNYQQNYPYSHMSHHYPHHPHAQSALNYSMNNKYAANLKLPLIDSNAPLQLATGPILYDY